LEGKPGWRWGEAGQCYTYTPGVASSEAIAKKRALAQALAISYSQKSKGNKPDLGA
jgi:hypothetical protein